jgi:hypothetical protein
MCIILLSRLFRRTVPGIYASAAIAKYQFVLGKPARSEKSSGNVSTAFLQEWREMMTLSNHLIEGIFYSHCDLWYVIRSLEPDLTSAAGRERRRGIACEHPDLRLRMEVTNAMW